MTPSVLKVERLRKRFKKRTVVKDVALEIASGEVVGLLGPNGAGKTTSFYMIVGLIGADDGEIRLDDQVITHYPIHHRARLGLGYLPQEASIFRRMTVEENIAAILEVSGLKGKELEKSWTCCWTTSTSATCATAARCRCPAASAAAWRSPACWPPGRASSCWTNPSPASTRSR